MKRILVVEDNTPNRVLVRDILRYHGYEVCEASNGMEAIEMARGLPPDLILLDIQMPVMDGFAVIRRLREFDVTRDVKIVAVTSFAMQTEKARIAEAGFDGYIAKPIDTRYLPEFIKKYLT